MMKKCYFAVLFLLLLFMIIPVKISAASSCYLKSLNIQNGTMAPAFDPKTNTYNVVIKSQETRLQLNIVPKDPAAVVTVAGNDSITSGTVNKVTITVKSGSSGVNTYNLLVYRESEFNNPINSDAMLNSIQINNGTVPISFSSKQYFYQVPLNANIHELSINADKINQNDKVEILGSKEVVGQNPQIVNIIVTDSLGKGSSVYTLYFSKNIRPANKMIIVFVGLAAMISGIIGTLLILHLIVYKRNGLNAEIRGYHEKYKKDAASVH